MKSLFFISVLFIASGFILRKNNYSICGIIVSSNKQEPIKDASVQYTIQNGVKTDKKGKFCIEKLAPANYKLRVTAQDYESFDTSVQIISSNILKLKIVLKEHHIYDISKN